MMRSIGTSSRRIWWDSIVVRQIFNIAESDEVRVETDKILVELQDIAATFGDFAGYFVKHHSK